uniref:Uncharacterized protein n=1 Tax=Salix viminalis TaxID=40686 RepID=A0A6N2LDX4_SALVM
MADTKFRNGNLGMVGRHHLPAMHFTWTTGCDFPSILRLPPIWKRTPRHMWRRPQTIFLPVVGLVDPDKLKPGDLVGGSKDSYLILDTLPSEYDSRVKAMEVDEKPTEDYNDIGGLEKQVDFDSKLAYPNDQLSFSVYASLGLALAALQRNIIQDIDGFEAVELQHMPFGLSHDCVDLEFESQVWGLKVLGFRGLRF